MDLCLILSILQMPVYVNSDTYVALLVFIGIRTCELMPAVGFI